MIDEVKNDRGAFDMPDDRDFSVEHLFGAAEIECPNSVDLNKVPSQKQGKTMHCTSYALTHCIEILNTLEFNVQAIADAEEQWANQLYNRGNPPYMEKEGDSLQNALQTLLKYGLTNKSPQVPVDKFLIDGYARIDKTVKSFRTWLAKGYPIYTGSGNHCFAIVGYHDGLKVFVVKNSLKLDPFNSSYEKIDTLFTPYILYDKKDLNMIYKDVSENSPMAEAIKYCLDKGIMTGYGASVNPLERTFQPDKPVTRAELSQVIFNLSKDKN